MTELTDGQEYDVTGGTQSSIRVDSGGPLYVESGGVVSSTNDNGYVFLSGHSYAYYTSLNSNGSVDVSGNQILSSSTTCYTTVYAGGIASGVTANSGGTTLVYSGGTALGLSGTIGAVTKMTFWRRKPPPRQPRNRISGRLQPFSWRTKRRFSRRTPPPHSTRRRPPTCS